VNNGSEPQTLAYLEQIQKRPTNSEYRGVSVIQNSENRGFIKATNQALAQVERKEHALLLNDDTQITDPFWLQRMVHILETERLDDKSIGAVGPTTNYVLGEQMVTFNHERPLLQSAKFLIGFCMLVRNDVLKRTGLLDERFGVGMNEDLDYSMRIRNNGYALAIARDVFVLHYGSQSMNRLEIDAATQEAVTRQMLVNKWGYEEVNELFQP